jgi:hypothetical protein
LGSLFDAFNLLGLNTAQLNGQSRAISKRLLKGECQVAESGRIQPLWS